MDHIYPAEDSLSAQPDERQLAAEAPASQIVAALYERYRDDVYAYCQRRLRNPEEAEDATQVTFLKAFTGLKNGAVPQVENAWLFTIAKRVVFTRLEATDRLRAVEAKTDVDGVAEERGGPVERAAMDDVWKAVEALPEAPRRAFLMREWQGLEYDEIAQELGVERNHVGVILFRARSRVIASLSGNKVLRSLGNVGSLSAVVRRIAGFFAGEASQLTVAVTVAASPVAVLATHDHATGTPTPARSVVAATYAGRVASGSNAILRAPVTGESRIPFIVQQRPTTPVPRVGGESTSPAMPAASPGGPVGNTDDGGSVARDPTPATDPVEAAGLPTVGGGVDPSTGPGDGVVEEQKRTTSGWESGSSSPDSIPTVDYGSRPTLPATARLAGGSADAASRNPYVSGGKVFVDASSPKRSVDPARGRGEGSKGKGWIELGAREAPPGKTAPAAAGGGDGHGNGHGNGDVNRPPGSGSCAGNGGGNGRGNGNGSSGAGSSAHSGGQAPANRGSPQGSATLEPTQPPAESPVLLGADEGSVKGDGNGAANGKGNGAANGHGHGNGNGASAAASPAHGGGQAAGDEGGSSPSDALGLPAAAAQPPLLAPAADAGPTNGNGDGNGNGNGNGGHAAAAESSVLDVALASGTPVAATSSQQTAPDSPAPVVAADPGPVHGNGHAAAASSSAHAAGASAADTVGVPSPAPAPTAEVAALAPAAAPETPLVTAPPAAAAPVAVPPPVATPVATPPAADVSGTPAKKPKK